MAKQQTTMQAKRIEIALDLIDFCGSDLSISSCRDFFKLHDENYDVDIDEQEQTAIFFIALGLIRK